MIISSSFQEPKYYCNLCTRLSEYRLKNKDLNNQWFNGPVPAFGRLDAKLLIVGLAPGLKGANATGRPFTGDYAGDLLYSTLEKYGFSKGSYKAQLNDGLELINCRITNAVRCVPPKNKPTNNEIKTCRTFLSAEISQMHDLLVILALGRVAHTSMLTLFNLKQASWPFKHARNHSLPNGLMMVDSYHCSRYNTNTGRLTVDMFENVFDTLAKICD